MLIETSCEICGENDWEILGRRTYVKSEGGKYSPYVTKRYRILFDKWFVDKERITLASKLCRRCGLIIYTPRPETKDIDAKYKYIEELGQDYGRNIPHNSLVEIKRSKSIRRYVRKYINLGNVKKILDYGGGDGRLMYAFNVLGKRCYVVDYNMNPVQGVTKLADTIEQLDPQEKFDLIVCSHVLEHVAQPRRVLKKLADHLNPDGHIYIQVPMEVWKRPPLHTEPVTHINFFTLNSIYNLIVMSGLSVMNCKMAGCLYPSGGKGRDIRAIGCKMNGTGKKQELRDPDGIKLIEPGIFRTMHYHMLTPVSSSKGYLINILKKVKNRIQQRSAPEGSGRR